MKHAQVVKTKIATLLKELRSDGIRDKRILDAIEKIPRTAFIDDQLARFAYDNRPLQIGKEQTISQPFTVAYHTELLSLAEGEKILEIGTGSGYQAAVLCEMKAHVFSIERYYELHKAAKSVLEKLGYTAQLFFGDGYDGLPEYAPFDKILITAAAYEIPSKLLTQLRIGGKMVLPLGNRFGQTMTIIKRQDEDIFQHQECGQFTFVPMKKGVVRF